MALIAGARVGMFEIVASLGRGGMGEVYRARDVRLNRDVALKVLPEGFTGDADRRARLQREAHVLASLNHQNIASIYGFEDADGVQGLVMELVEGPTLADRLAAGAMPLDDVLPVARQLADALHAAHEHGIVHRDFKPSNIKLRPDGTVKVLDFGLAKALDGGSESPDLTHSPTMTSPALTRQGVLLGTAAYMSPEQARGLAVDKRTDIWAFGCVVYEMLCGRAPFAGETLTDTLAAIVHREPDWHRLPESIPQKLRVLIERCLRKDQKRRLHDIADARIEIDDAVEDARTGAEPRLPSYSSGRTSRTERLTWIAIVALLAIAVAAAMLANRRNRTVSSVFETRLEIVTPPTTDPVSLAVSPDGRTVTFVATDAGRSRLWLRPLGSDSSRPLPGTESAYYPFWSPDGKSIGFFADGKLKRIDLETTSVQVLADASAGRGGTWNKDDVILFAPQAGPLFRIAASGGQRTQVTQTDRQRLSHRFPQFLPDGHHFTYFVRPSVGAPDVRGVYVGDLDGTTSQRLVDADVAAVLAGTNQLLFVRQSTLFAQHFDPVRLELSGKAAPLASHVVNNTAFGTAAVSASANGLIAYRTGPAEQRQLTWFDRSGRELGPLGEPDSGDPSDMALSPDGGLVAVSREVDENRDIWLYDTSRGSARRMTYAAGIDRSATWSPDGNRLIFTSSRGGNSDLYQKLSNSDADESLFLSTPDAEQAADFSPDGSFLLFRTQNLKTRYDIWAVAVERTATGELRARDGKPPFVVVQTNADERDPQFSPDGRWIAYESDESGRFEIYVQPFPGRGQKWPVSKGGGAQVRWPRIGHELFYIGLDDRLMSVRINMDAGRQTVSVGDPVALFQTRVGGAVTVRRQQYAVSPDGQRFLMNAIKEEAGASPITIVQNWSLNSFRID